MVPRYNYTLITPKKCQFNNKATGVMAIFSTHSKFRTLTCIDPVSNVAEAIRIRNKTSEHVAKQFRNSWLSRYPNPFNCIHDNGREFIGWNFQEMLTQAGIQSKPTTVKNPHSNAVYERMHKTVVDIL